MNAPAKQLCDERTSQEAKVSPQTRYLNWSETVKVMKQGPQATWDYV